MSSQQQSKQQIKLNQLNSILSTNSSNQQTLNETEAISKVNLWQIRELAIGDGGLLNGTFVFYIVDIVLGVYSFLGVCLIVFWYYSFIVWRCI